MTASPASLRLIGALNKSGEPGAKSRAPDNKMLGTKQQQGNSYDHDPPQIIGWIHQYMPHIFAGGGAHWLQCCTHRSKMHTAFFMIHLYQLF